MAAAARFSNPLNSFVWADDDGSGEGRGEAVVTIAMPAADFGIVGCGIVGNGVISFASHQSNRAELIIVSATKAGRGSFLKVAVMRRALYCTLILIASAAIAVRADPRALTLTYATSGTCVNSPEGFNSKLEPTNPGTAWMTTFNAAGSADANGNVTEVGQSVDTASFGAGPRMHSPAANAYRGTFTSRAEPNSDGSYSIATGVLSGAFTDGPYAGQTFTAAPGLPLKQSPGQNGVSIQTTTGAPVIQTFSLSNGIRFQRICIVRAVVTSSPK